jgi:4-hydroxy-tetrahydrodipicolinate synthase
MKNIIFTGAGVAIVTPFLPNGDVNYSKLAELLDWQIEAGTDAVVICGTTGESPTLTPEEHADVIRYTIKHVAGRIPVIAGTGSNDTAFALKLSLEAEEAGADGLLMVTPYYNKTSQAGLLRHYFHVADRVKTPILLYNVPSRTGVNILPETYLELSKHPNINGIKEANGDISALAKVRRLCGEEMNIYTGNDDQITAFTVLGGKGVISVLSNIAPKAAHNIAQAALDGDFVRSAALQLEWLDLCTDMFCDVNPIPVKEALNLMGYQVGNCRLPLIETNSEKKAQIKASLQKHGLI